MFKESVVVSVVVSPSPHEAMKAEIANIPNNFSFF
jgi:hypothetical protein